MIKGGFSLQNLTSNEKILATQRLTALWAFNECGLGGVLHALHIPFSGLLLCGIALTVITLIAFINQNNQKVILQNLVVVLLVKLSISPHTSPPAYLAVFFQAWISYLLYSLFGVRLISILVVCLLSTIESAVQKFLVLTIFFGKNFWKALDGLVKFITEQFSYSNSNGSLWIVGIYMAVYFVGGILIAILINKVLGQLTTQQCPAPPGFTDVTDNKTPARKKSYWKWLTILLCISVVIFFIEPDEKQKWLNIAKAVSYTITAIAIWYIAIVPLFSKLLMRLLQNSKKQYSNQVAQTLSVLPYFRKLTTVAWQQTQTSKGLKRIALFMQLLLLWTLTYEENTEH